MNDSFKTDSSGEVIESWQGVLHEWLQVNQKQMPEALQQQRDQFITAFPKERLDQLTLEQYVLGLHADKTKSFCWWIEYGTKELGSIGGSPSDKHGVWYSSGNEWKWHPRYSSAEDAFQQVRSG